MGMIKQDSGEVVKNDDLEVGYYSQEFETLTLIKVLLKRLQMSQKRRADLPELSWADICYRVTKHFNVWVAYREARKQGWRLRF